MRVAPQDREAILTAINQPVTCLYVQDDFGQTARQRVEQAEKEETPGIGALGVCHWWAIQDLNL